MRFIKRTIGYQTYLLLPDEIEAQREQFEKHGYIERRAIVARKPFFIKCEFHFSSNTVLSSEQVFVRLYQQDYDQFAAVDTSMAWTKFPMHVDVLTLHGLKDSVVPPYDAFIYSRAYGARSPGTHMLRYVEDADHNFTGVRLLNRNELYGDWSSRVDRCPKKS